MLGSAVIARRAGRLDEALEQAQAAYATLDLQAERMAPHGQAMMLGQLCLIQAARGEVAAARDYGRQAVELALGTEDMPLVAGIVESWAEVEVVAGDLAQGARAFGMAATLRGLRAVGSSDVRRSHERLREQLGADGFEAAYEAGAGLTREEALAELRSRITPA
jgi:hypothetical protein